MRYIFISFLFVASFVCTPIPSALAHQIKTSGTISVLQHADPNDEPVAGASSVIYLHFGDTENSFTGEMCDCVAYVAPYSQLENIKDTGDTFIFGSEAVNHLYGENYSFSYMFPKKDIYAIVVEGVPKDGGAFDPFRIVFDVRVDRIATANENSVLPPSATEEQVSPLLIGILATVLLLILILIGILIRKYLYLKK